MKHKYLLAVSAIALALGLPSAAHAAGIKGYTNSAAELLAGPRADYPSVSHVESGVNVDVIGCVQGFTWCDVSWNGNRGWIDGRYLDSIYKDHRANVVELGPQENLPVVTFEQRSYWDSNYHDRPFYTEHRYWTTTTSPQ